MSTQWLFIKPEEPLLLGKVKYNTNFLSTLDYIPGRVLRGSWARWLMTKGRTKNIADEVKTLRIGNFFPIAEWRNLEYVSPFMLSMLTCKQKGGFQTEPHRDKRGHGVVDSLLPNLTYYLLKRSSAELSIPFVTLCQDQSCESRMEHYSGFFSANRDGQTTRYVESHVKYHTQTRAAISRYRNAAHEGMLYTATSLRPVTDRPDIRNRETDLVFVGQVKGSEDKIEELVQALNSTPIGSKCSIGYGSISCKRGTVNMPSLENRLDAFNRLLTELWADLKRLACNREALSKQPLGLYFSIDLVAPAILRDNRGLPCLVPHVDIDGKVLEPVFWLTRPDFAGGWSEAWGLPKPTALAARMGSSYAFRWDGSRDELVNYLERIEASGVGERCDEGFGECWICHPFHQEVREK